MKYLILAVLLLTGCLVTRQEVRQGSKSVPLTQEQVAKSNAEVRLQESEELVRQLTGRIEVIENSMNVLSADKSGQLMEQQSERRALTERLKIYEETLTRLEQQNLLLAQKVEAIQLALTSGSTKATSSGDKNSFQTAQNDYEKKRWNEAIFGFDRYRTQNPKGKQYAEATFKIGAAFYELKMKTEARAYFAEVVEKFPNSEWAKRARQRLNQIK